MGRDGDDNLFDRAMGDVRPLKRPPAAPEPQVAAAKPVPAKPKPKTKPARPASAVPKPEAPPPPPPGAGLDRRQQERLRRGQMKIEGRLDLHGLHQSPAHGALRAFITESHASGRRCVLVITGKGNRQSGHQQDSVMPDRALGVLRREVPRWLRQPELKDKVLSVSEAQPKHGGAGALYVLLRKRR